MRYARGVTLGVSFAVLLSNRVAAQEPDTSSASTCTYVRCALTIESSRKPAGKYLVIGQTGSLQRRVTMTDSALMAAVTTSPPAVGEATRARRFMRVGRVVLGATLLYAAGTYIASVARKPSNPLSYVAASWTMFPPLVYGGLPGAALLLEGERHVTHAVQAYNAQLPR